MFLGGTVIENETNVGITHLLEHLLLSMKADDNLSIFFDTEGVDIRGETAREYMNISGYFLSSQKKIFLKRLIDDIYLKNIESEELERNKKIVQCEIQQYINTEKNIRLKENKMIFNDSLWENDILGNMHSVEDITLDDVNDFRNNLLENNRCVMSLIGNIDYDEIDECTYPLGIIRAKGQKNLILDVNNCSFPQFNVLKYTNQEKGSGNTYSDISITYKLNWYPLEQLIPCIAIFNTMLTGLGDSILMKKLREELNYVYQVISYPEIHKSICLFKVRTKTLKKYCDFVVNEIKMIFKEFCCSNKNDYSSLFLKAKKRVYNEIMLIEENKPLETVSQLSKSYLFNQPTNVEILHWLETIDYKRMRFVVQKAFDGLKESSIFINES